MTRVMNVENYIRILSKYIADAGRREDVIKEFSDYVEDSIEELCESGMTREKAEEIILRQMGDPIQAGKEMGRIYNRFFDIKMFLYFSCFRYWDVCRILHFGTFWLRGLYMVPRDSASFCGCSRNRSCVVSVCLVSGRKVGELQSFLCLGEKLERRRNEKQRLDVCAWNFIFRMLPWSKKYVSHGFVFLYNTIDPAFFDRTVSAAERERAVMGDGNCIYYNTSI